MKQIDGYYNLERIEVIADLFSSLGFDGIVRFDLLEPEYIALKRIYELNTRPDFLGLIALSTGIIDFQLGLGGAEHLWSVLTSIAERMGELNNIEHVRQLMEMFLEDPVNARFLRIKRNRIKRIFDGGFATWYMINYENLRKKPIVLWSRLAQVLGSPMNKKTIVFSMKAFDIANLICYGDYLPFPEDIPIPVDFHVKCVTISAGLLNRYSSDEDFRQVWKLVLNRVKRKLNRNITLLRLDSIVWQVGKIMYTYNYEEASSRKHIEDYLAEKINIERNLANKIALELTQFINNLKNIIQTSIEQ